MSAPFTRVTTTDRNFNQLQSNITRALMPIFNNPLISGILLTEVALVSGDNTIDHGLNRPLQGWVITRIRASATIYDKQDDNLNPRQTLVLNASADVTVDLYVF